MWRKIKEAIYIISAIMTIAVGIIEIIECFR